MKEKNCMKCQVFWFKESLCNDEVCSNYCAKGNQDDFMKMIRRPKGKWIKYMDCEGKSRRITCDKCGHEEWNWLNPNFCSNCGADMRINND